MKLLVKAAFAGMGLPRRVKATASGPDDRLGPMREFSPTVGFASKTQRG